MRGCARSRYGFLSFNLALAIFMAVLIVPSAWLAGLGPRGRLGVGIAIVVATIGWAAWSLKSVHGGLEGARQLCELEGWNGILYNNPRDPRLWVPKISGFGTTLNFAHRGAWLMLGSIFLLSLGAAAVGIVSALRR